MKQIQIFPSRMNYKNNILVIRMSYIHTYMHTDIHNSRKDVQKHYIDQKEPDTEIITE